MASELVTNYGSKKITICNWTVEPKKTGKKYEFLHFQGNQKDIYFLDIHSLWQMTKNSDIFYFKNKAPCSDNFQRQEKTNFKTARAPGSSLVVVKQNRSQNNVSSA